MRRTIANPVHKSGVGLHSGKACSVILRPSTESGWRINQYDLRELPIVSGQLATVLQVGRNTVSTVEHLFSALYAHQIDDIQIEIKGGEVPILDGSAREWFQAITPQPITEHIQILEPKEHIFIEHGDAWIRLMPSSQLSVSVKVDFEGYSPQFFDGALCDFEDAMDARTFGYVEQLADLHKHGFAKGASLDNVLGLFRDSHESLDQPQMAESELAKHKRIDLIGDLALIGTRLNARITSYRAGHRLHHQLVAKLRELSM